MVADIASDLSRCILLFHELPARVGLKGTIAGIALTVWSISGRTCVSLYIWSAWGIRCYPVAVCTASFLKDCNQTFGII